MASPLGRRLANAALSVVATGVVLATAERTIIKGLVRYELRSNTPYNT
ncbi:hypothetical protein [Nostoc sp.]